MSPVWMWFQGLCTFEHESQAATLRAQSQRQQRSHRMQFISPASCVLALPVHLSCEEQNPVRAISGWQPLPSTSTRPAKLIAGEASWASRPQCLGPGGP